MQAAGRRGTPILGRGVIEIMRILLAGAATALLSITAATPAFAQFGGSPQQQVDGAPGQSTQQAPDQDEDDQAVAPDDDQAAYAKPGAEDDQDAAYAGQDDASADQGNADSDMDQGDADNDAEQGDVDADQDQAKPGESDGGVASGGGYAQTWQGEDGRTYCRRSDGTTGAVVGGGAGALVGRGIDGGRRRTGGTIIGAIAGALIGSAIERSANQQSCGG